MQENGTFVNMGKTFHSKYEFKKLVKDLSVRAAKAGSGGMSSMLPGRKNNNPPVRTGQSGQFRAPYRYSS